MIGCGISISGSEAVLIWADLPSGSVLLKTAKKVQVADAYLQRDVVQVADLVRQLIAERRTDLVVVRKSSTSGKFPASHVAFRLETMITLASPVEVRFIAPQGVAAYLKKCEVAIPDTVLKYQQEAYLALIAEVSS